MLPGLHALYAQMFMGSCGRGKTAIYWSLGICFFQRSSSNQVRARDVLLRDVAGEGHVPLLQRTLLLLLNRKSPRIPARMGDYCWLSTLSLLIKHRQGREPIKDVTLVQLISLIFCLPQLCSFQVIKSFCLIKAIHCY